MQVVGRQEEEASNRGIKNLVVVRLATKSEEIWEHIDIITTSNEIALIKRELCLRKNLPWCLDVDFAEANEHITNNLTNVCLLLNQVVESLGS